MTESMARPSAWEDSCEEVIGAIGKLAINCGQPTVALIQHRGRNEGPYFMCYGCYSHNVRHRDAEAIAFRLLQKEHP